MAQPAKLRAMSSRDLRPATCDLRPAHPAASHAGISCFFRQLWEDEPLNRSPYGNDLKCDSDAEVHVDYSCVGEIYGSLTSSNHLIRTDPLLANPTADDFHLLYGSPCIDSGAPTYFGTAFDLDGESRPYGAAIDMGADEFTDADADHMADYWELAHFGVLTNSDGTADGDNDTLDDFAEYMNQTDPSDRDTDNDLAEDGWEAANGYNPLDRDMDADGMWDGWEAMHGLSAFTNSDAILDLDGDEMSNLAEFTADTNPTNAASLLRMLWIGEQWGGTRLDWQGGIGAWQFLEVSTNLADPADWQTVLVFPPPRQVTNAVVYWGHRDRSQFYRIRTERP